jgi:hypothetical protein
MDPLITNGIEPVLPGGLEKRSAERDPIPRRKTPPPSAKPDAEDDEAELAIDIAKHTLDDLA